jgi:flavin-dependent dehydrogenase
MVASYDVIIVGGGPAGSAAAISLSANGVRTLLVEEKHMPREKLCGEFVTPESFPTLKRLGVMDRMLAAGGRQLTRLCLSPANGRLVQAAFSDISIEAGWVLSLSRARFDHVLFERARETGAECVEGFAVKQCITEKGRICGIEGLSLADGSMVEHRAPIVIDASGRNSRLTIGRRDRVGGKRGTRLYAMKAHLRDVRGIEDQVELYFFPEGYGGLSQIEDGLVNLCFIAGERTFGEAAGNPQRVLDRTVLKNDLARERLAGARLSGKWMTVGPLVFGKRRRSQDGPIAIGDASGMIDPFTGTGIQIALRSGEIIAESIVATLGSAGEGLLPLTPRESVGQYVAGPTDPNAERVIRLYAKRYDAEFGHRLRVAGALRKLAFSTSASNLFAGVLERVPWLARRVLRATRSA